MSCCKASILLLQAALCLQAGNAPGGMQPQESSSKSKLSPLWRVTPSVEFSGLKSMAVVINHPLRQTAGSLGGCCGLRAHTGSSDWAGGPAMPLCPGEGCEHPLRGAAGVCCAWNCAIATLGMLLRGGYGTAGQPAPTFGHVLHK